MAKTYGGTSWSSTQSKVSKAQKINGILNVFGAYDHTNDKMHVHGYKKKNGHQFIDFLKGVVKRFDDAIKNVFVVLDNLSVHKSKKVKEKMAKYCPRIKFVFLPVRSPELNLIEVRWSWLQRQTINNSIPISKSMRNNRYFYRGFFDKKAAFMTRLIWVGDSHSKFLI